MTKRPERIGGARITIPFTSSRSGRVPNPPPIMISVTS